MTPVSLMLLFGRPNVIIARCGEVIERILNPYRPELYYMRGPGPRWHARQRASRQTWPD
jgi:hypothetical protein